MVIVLFVRYLLLVVERSAFFKTLSQKYGHKLLVNSLSFKQVRDVVITMMGFHNQIRIFNGTCNFHNYSFDTDVIIIIIH